MRKWKKVLAVLLLFSMCLSAAATVSAAEITVETTAASGINEPESETTGTEEKKEEESKSSSQNKNGMISNDEFNIRVSFGLGGNCRSGAAVPVTVFMTSLKSDFEGIVRIIVCGDGDTGTQGTAYEKEIMLTKDSEKTITMSVNNLSNMASYYLQIEDSNGNIRVEKKMSSNIRTGESALVGILSDDYTALNYFDRLNLTAGDYSGMTKLVELSPELMPEQASGLDVLSFLIINSFDTSELSDAQCSAIESWVEHGGVLIIGTGADYKKTLSAFQNGMISGTISGMKEGTLALSDSGMPAVNDLTGTNVAEGEPVSEPLPGMGILFTAEQGILNMKVADAAPLENVLSDKMLLWNRDYGQGHVIAAAFNLGMEPVSSWAGKEDMAEALLTRSASGYSAVRISNLNYGSYQDYWSVFNTLGSLFEQREPDFNMLGLLLAVFVIMAGPGLYLFLKLIDKREWMWGLIPILAVSVTAGIFFITKDLRLNAPVEMSLTTFLEEDGSGHTVRTNVVMDVMVPTAEKETITVSENLSNMKLINRNYYEADNGKDYKVSICETAEGYRVGFRNRETFGQTWMTYDMAAETSVTEGLETRIVRNTTGLSGTVANHTGYDLEGVCVVSGNKRIVIGSMRQDESVEFSEKDNQTTTDYDPYSFGNIPGLEVDSAEYRKIVNIWTCLFEQYAYASGSNLISSSNTYTFAVIPDLAADYVKDDRVKEYNYGAIVKHTELALSDYPGCSILRLYDYAENNNNWDSDGMMRAQIAEVDFDLSTSLNGIRAMVRNSDSQAMYGNTGNTKIYGWNVYTSQYEELFTGDMLQIDFTNVTCPYLSENGKIRLKFECRTAYEDYSPEIAVIGGGF